MKRNRPSIVLSLFLGAVLMAFPASAVANLLTNSGFESGYAGWTTFGSGIQLSAVSGDSLAHTGDEAAKTFGEFTGCPFPVFDVGGFLQALAPVAGMNYDYSGFAYVSSGDPIAGVLSCSSNRCIAKLAFFDAAVGGAEISSNEIIIGDPNTPLDQWVEFSFSALAPVGAARLEVLILYLQPGCETGAVFVDDLTVTLSTPPVPGANLLANPSFDTSLLGWTAFGNAILEDRGNTIPQFAFARRTPPGAMKAWSSGVLGDDSGVFQGFPAAGGTDWEMEAWALTSCVEDPIEVPSDNTLIAKIVFLDGSFPAVEIGAVEKTLIDANSPTGTWTKHNLVAQAPAGTQTVRAFLLFLSPSLLTGDAVFVDDVSLRQATITGVTTAPRTLDFELSQNVPNPFRAATRIEFALPSRDNVELSVYDISGRRVAQLMNGSVGAGGHSVIWDGTTGDGRHAAVGVYQYVMRTSTGQASKRMMLIK